MRCLAGPGTVLLALLNLLPPRETNLVALQAVEKKDAAGKVTKAAAKKK